ncbi:hypothetical protein C5167_045027 [Papaver somniferum]|uniref:Vesicle-fusing ATPase n=1 Tax=Papaver somniferum TaxID=3469 RepID=A0A4Y7LCI2_PAPSO|nr:hypothetical protein C5167_045027 [Papaver somniferum]
MRLQENHFMGENQAMRSQGWLPFFHSAYQAVVEGEEKSNNLERGMIPSETYFFFEASNASGNLRLDEISLFLFNWLYGPPGTGKTLMARQIGQMLNGKDPKIVNGPEVLSKFVGETEKNVRDLFSDAENDQMTLGDQSEMHVIIFDEIDAIYFVSCWAHLTINFYERLLVPGLKVDV